MLSMAFSSSQLHLRLHVLEQPQLTIMDSFNKFWSFVLWGDKELKVVFFVCNCFDSIHVIRQNKYGMVEIKHNAKLPGNDDFILAHQVE
jgi:hypothetical protein